ncbi:MAG: OmpA family protein [Gammaproteobacteria bacterium]|nr:OmpA family protein [Gammaproteobacteria bacterium]
MRTRMLITASLALALGVALAPAAQARNDTPPDNRWFITGMASYPIDTGASDNDGWGGFLGIAKPFTDYFGLELNYQQYAVKMYDVPINQKLLGLDALIFMHRGTWNPYLQLGIGYTRMDFDSYTNRFGTQPGGDDNGAFGTFGFGVIWRVASYFDIRADLRYNGTFNDFVETEQPLGNFVASVGIAIPFGSPPQAAPPPPPPPTPIADTDGDGVPDNLDQCPGTPSGVSVNSQGCPLDDDGDGVPNYLDRCPNTPAGADVDVNGCVIQAVIDLPRTHFQFNSTELTAEDQEALDNAAATLNKYPEINVLVAGYTDSIGSEAYNLKLSRGRADSVKDYLVAHGVDADRLTTKGFGEADPVAPNRINGHDNPAGRAKNRRVELHVLNGDDM